MHTFSNTKKLLSAPANNHLLIRLQEPCRVRKSDEAVHKGIEWQPTECACVRVSVCLSIRQRQKTGSDKERQKVTEGDGLGRLKLINLWTRRTYSAQAGESWQSKLSWLSDIVAENAVWHGVPFCLSLPLSVCLYVCLPICLSVCLSSGHLRRRWVTRAQLTIRQEQHYYTWQQENLWHSPSKKRWGLSRCLTLCLTPSFH